MILTCPECGTQYMVKDGAIPPQGRQVRCAACKHSWHQDPERAPAAEADDESLAAATLIEPRSGPEAEERAFEAAMAKTDEGFGERPLAVPAEGQGAPEPADPQPAPADEGQVQPPVEPVGHEQEMPAVPDAAAAPADFDAPPDAEEQADVFSPFADDDYEEEPRRRSPLLKIVVAALIVAALAAAFWFLAPAELKARVGLGAGPASPLALVTTHMDRQRLESGNELLTVAGRVINPTGKDQSVPPLRAELKTRTGQLVYRWTIAPPARNLAPGASAAFNSTEVDVPPGGDELTITLGSDQA